MRSRIKRSAMFCNATVYRPRRSASTRPPGRHSFGLTWRCWRGPTSSRRSSRCADWWFTRTSVGGAKLNLAFVRNVRTWPAMPREKAQAATTARLKVPKRRTGVDCSVVAMKRGNARGAKREADKAENLTGCKSLYRQFPVFGRLAYPERGNEHDKPGRKSPGCPAGVCAAVGTIWGRANLEAGTLRNICNLETRALRGVVIRGTNAGSRPNLRLGKADATGEEIVRFNGYSAGTIVIKTNERRLYYVISDGKAIRYPVGVGKRGMAWSGTASIDGKYINPACTAPASLRRDYSGLPTVIPGGSPSNPMGAAAMTLSGGGEYAIHGTNNPGSVGGVVSHGCIRMYNQDILDLYEQVSFGTTVVVLR